MLKKRKIINNFLIINFKKKKNLIINKNFYKLNFLKKNIFLKFILCSKINLKFFSFLFYFIDIYYYKNKINLFKKIFENNIFDNVIEKNFFNNFLNKLNRNIVIFPYNILMLREKIEYEKKNIKKKKIIKEKKNENIFLNDLKKIWNFCKFPELKFMKFYDFHQDIWLWRRKKIFFDDFIFKRLIVKKGKKLLYSKRKQMEKWKNYIKRLKLNIKFFYVHKKIFKRKKKLENFFLNFYYLKKNNKNKLKFLKKNLLKKEKNNFFFFYKNKKKYHKNQKPCFLYNIKRKKWNNISNLLKTGIYGYKKYISIDEIRNIFFFNYIYNVKKYLSKVYFKNIFFNNKVNLFFNYFFYNIHKVKLFNFKKVNLLKFNNFIFLNNFDFTKLCLKNKNLFLLSYSKNLNINNILKIFLKIYYKYYIYDSILLNNNYIKKDIYNIFFDMLNFLKIKDNINFLFFKKYYDIIFLNNNYSEENLLNNDIENFYIKLLSFIKSEEKLCVKNDKDINNDDNDDDDENICEKFLKEYNKKQNKENVLL